MTVAICKQTTHNGLRKMNIELYICILFLIVTPSLSISTEYLTTSCNQSITVDIGISLQSTTAIEYSNSFNCYYVVNVPANHKVVAVFRRFELEDQINGACVDYVNFYDGTSTSASLVNSDPFCGTTIPTNITSTGTAMTVQMITDSSSTRRGFDLLLSAYSDAPCSSTQYACSNNFCISSSLECDNYNQCGDNSDESHCTDEDYAGDTSKSNTALIAGVVIGVGSFVIIGVLMGIYLYREYRWKLFLKDPLPVIQQWDNYNTYPLTNKYYKSFDDGYRRMRDKDGSRSDVGSPSDRPNTPNSAVSSKGILKSSQPTHSTA